jgi:hypothetical protein
MVPETSKAKPFKGYFISFSLFSGALVSWVYYSSLLSIDGFTKCWFVLAMLFSLLGVSKAMKRTKKKRVHQAIKCLPNNLMMKIFVKVASTSLSDFFELKLSCAQGFLWVCGI